MQLSGDDSDNCKTNQKKADHILMSMVLNGMSGGCIDLNIYLV